MSESEPQNAPHEFEGVMIWPSDGEQNRRPIHAKPLPLRATRGFVREVRDALGVPEERAEEAADWVLGKMDRFAAAHAEPVFTMDGHGPRCSYCGAFWPLCGHHLLAFPEQPEEGVEE